MLHWKRKALLAASQADALQQQAHAWAQVAEYAEQQAEQEAG